MGFGISWEETCGAPEMRNVEQVTWENFCAGLPHIALGSQSPCSKAVQQDLCRHQLVVTHCVEQDLRTAETDDQPRFTRDCRGHERVHVREAWYSIRTRAVLKHIMARTLFPLSLFRKCFTTMCWTYASIADYNTIYINYQSSFSCIRS